MVKSLVIDALEALGAFRLKRMIKRREPLVLMYHRILDHPLIPGVKPAVFAEHLEYIKRHFRVIPMGQLAEEVRDGTVKPYSVALTFDDGHRDFYSNAWPVLKDNGLLASVYVTTGFIDKTTWLWPDRLRYLLMNTRTPSVDLEGVGTLAITDATLMPVWNTLGDYCLSLEPGAREAFLKNAAEALAVTLPSEPTEPFAPMTWLQLREMASDGLEVGSHSVSHPILSHLEDDELEMELRQSRDRIEAETGMAPTGICYPNGMAGDTSARVERMAQRWYDYGLVAFPGRLTREAIMHLGRWAAPTKTRRLRQILSGMTRNDNQRGEYR